MDRPYQTSPEATKKLRWTLNSVLAGFAPPPPLTITQWAEENRTLTAEGGCATPGQYRVSRTPYMAEVMDAFIDPTVREVVGMFSAQVAKTTVIENVVGYHMHHKPMPIMVVQKRAEDAEKFSKTRLSNMIETTPVLSAVTSKATSRNSGNTILRKKFNGGSLSIVGANSPDSLRGESIGLAIGDELSSWEDTPQGDPVELLEARTTRFPNARRGYFSTPNVAPDCKVTRKYALSDQRRYYTACPKCEESSVYTYDAIEGIDCAILKWEDGSVIKLDNGQHVRTASEAWFECPHCGNKINDAQRSIANGFGEWRSGAEFRGVAGFWAWEANYPGSLAITFANKWLAAQGSTKQMQAVKNQVFGLPWKERGAVMDWRRLYDRAENYALGTVPSKVAVCFGGIDVQGNRIEAYVYGYGENLEQWLIDFTVIEGDPNGPVPWQQLANFVNSVAYPGADGAMFPVLRWAIDSGHLAPKVYEWASRFQRDKVMIVKGEQSGTTYGRRGADIEISTVSGAKRKIGHALWLVNKTMLIDQLYNWLLQDAPTAERLAEEGYPTGYLHTPHMEEEYFRQLTADVKISGVYKDKVNFHRNEALDIKCYCDFLAATIKFQRRHAQNVPLPVVTAQTQQQATQARPAPRPQSNPGWMGGRSKGWFK